APPPEGAALPGALPAAGEGAARRPERGARDRADPRVLDGIHGLVALAGLARGVLVARFNFRLRGGRLSGPARRAPPRWFASRPHAAPAGGRPPRPQPSCRSPYQSGSRRPDPS